MLSVENLPSIENIEKNEIYEIRTNNVGYFTHSFFKYPAKFIPQIPAWAINNFTNPNDIVLDCFAGSGTTLTEASISNRECLGVDFDEISKLLSKVKSTKLTKRDIVLIRQLLSKFNKKEYKNKALPNLKNLNHWFPIENIETLNALYYFISEQKASNKIKDFLLVCYISSIRKSSYSDEQSPKPYISSKHKKEPKETFELFNNIVKKNITKIDTDEYELHFKAKFIGNDAKNFKSSKYYNKIKLVCASPPYINAFDYVRVLRLENVWLRNLDDKNIIEHKKNQIGTEQIYASEYNEIPHKFDLLELDNKINELFKIDKKRAHIVSKYFLDMEENLLNIRKYLVDDGHYVLVVGDCEIRKIVFPIYKYLIELAERNSYSSSFVFSYLIRNPYLRIPRKQRGGLIKYDRIIVLKK
jgi:16S rRNA G966 N2-methylase RsmD